MVNQQKEGMVEEVEDIMVLVVTVGELVEVVMGMEENQDKLAA